MGYGVSARPTQLLAAFFGRKSFVQGALIVPIRRSAMLSDFRKRIHHYVLPRYAIT